MKVLVLCGSLPACHVIFVDSRKKTGLQSVWQIWQVLDQSQEGHCHVKWILEHDSWDCFKAHVFGKMEGSEFVLEHIF